MKRIFKEWLSTFRPCIADYCYYVDFDKVNRNVDSLKVELNILNKKNNETINNPYLALLENQKKVFLTTKQEIEKTIALVEEIL